jgi:hypothetical protein
MAAKKRDDAPKKDPLADEIDALLKKLPHAEPEPAAPKVPSPPPPVRRPAPSGPRAPAPREGRPPLGVWAQVAGGVVLGGALTQWPYVAACGWGLLGYAAAVVALLIVGGWCAMESWRSRLGAAHVVSLVLVFWGVALAAEVLLPRIGYAADEATWRCVAEADAVPSRALPAQPAAVPADTLAPGDSAAGALASDTNALPTDSVTSSAETSPDSLQD